MSKTQVGRTVKFEWWLGDKFYAAEWKECNDYGHGKYTASGPHTIKKITIGEGGTEFFCACGELIVNGMFTTKRLAAAHARTLNA